MKREPTPTAGELAEGLRRLCPGREGDFVTALRWLYDHPREAAALCGLEEAPSQGELLSALRQGDRPEFLALAAWRLVAERKNRTRENERYQYENRRIQELAPPK